MAKVTFEAVTKRFDEVRAVDSLDLEVHDGELLVLLGPYDAVRIAIANAEDSMFVNGVSPSKALAAAATASNQLISAYNARLGAG